MNTQRSVKITRLIDADLLKENIIKCLKPLEPEEEMIDSDVALLSTIMEIDKQPTAFDVDEVVEQLKNYLFEKYYIEGDTTIDEIVKGWWN